MYRINCNYCGEEITFIDLAERPETCPNCFSSLEEIDIQNISDTNNNQTETQEDSGLDGLTLIYQKTNETIHIPHTDKIILGRESFGSEVLGKIPQISGIHCSIEFIDNQYKITDLNSKNGTYTGISKIDCKLNPKQSLNDSNLLFLGKEPFLIKLNFRTGASEKTVKTTSSEEKFEPEEETKRFRCLVCAKEFDEKKEICDGCGSYGQWEVIEQ
ncbi:MAG: FHA domain-containing protein [Desulfobacteraceae bacterium]|nr:FHA domain-containing protein [Desulfobacteraceae bacterium]MBC2718815.1 FHA domain-containing protein [Desulfobacteraceae bacterium]